MVWAMYVTGPGFELLLLVCYWLFARYVVFRYFRKRPTRKKQTLGGPRQAPRDRFTGPARFTFSASGDGERDTGWEGARCPFRFPQFTSSDSPLETSGATRTNGSRAGIVFAGTADIDFGKAGSVCNDFLFPLATALWQGGGNLGAYLGLLTRARVWYVQRETHCRPRFPGWLEKRWAETNVFTVAGGASFGWSRLLRGRSTTRHPFIFEPNGLLRWANLFYRLRILSIPPSTPAMEGAHCPPFTIFYVGKFNGPRLKNSRALLLIKFQPDYSFPNFRGRCP